MESKDCPVCKKWIERSASAGGVLSQDECELQTIHFGVKHPNEQMWIFGYDRKKLDSCLDELKKKHGLT
jgi:hypothetical protein